MSATVGERAGAPREHRARCAWCGGPAEPSEGRLAYCPDCGAATTYPVPGEEELSRAYSGWYRPASGRFSAGGDRLLSLSRARLARRLDQLAPPGPVLDVGCGDGTLVRALRRRGREAVGLERSAAGEGIRAGEIVEFDERMGKWAGVIFWHSLEHVADSAAAIDRAVALLAPGGLLVIAVPNLASWQARCFGRGWFHLDLPRHLVHLTAPALGRGLEARGLTIERWSHWRGGQLMFGWLAGFVAALPGELDLYRAIRRPEARDAPLDRHRRSATLLLAGVLTPVAALLSAAESAARAGGTVYVEARRR